MKTSNKYKRSRYTLTDNWSGKVVFMDLTTDIRTLIARISDGKSWNCNYLTVRYGKEIYQLELEQSEQPEQLAKRKIE